MSAGHDEPRLDVGHHPEAMVVNDVGLGGAPCERAMHIGADSELADATEPRTMGLDGVGAPSIVGVVLAQHVQGHGHARPDQSLAELRYRVRGSARSRLMAGTMC